MPSLDLKILHSLLSQVSKPAQYLGNEVNVIKKDFDSAKVKVALVFPDKYELGMSHIGLKILYDILNKLPDVVAERCFAPDLDMEKELREKKIPLFSLESKRPLSEFDVIGFSLTYELTYVNFLNILDLAGIPLWQKDRKSHHPLIIAGGGCTMNAEPFADFLDAACLGDGEELILDLVNVIRDWKNDVGVGPRAYPAEGNHKGLPLHDRLSQIDGVYVPSFFRPEYNDDQTIKKMVPLKPGYERVKKRILQKLDQAPYPTNLLVSSVKLVHDRVGIEIQRGCNRACRFCQAGYIDRPVRQRSPENILAIAEESLANTGMDSVSLLSLSAADYGCIVPLMQELNSRYATKKVSISVPATRTEKLTPELADQIKQVRKTGFTIAPEAGTERMRRVINKGNKVDDLFRAIHTAFSKGWDLLKLYYMVGLPFETDEDVIGIASEANQGIKICFQYSGRSELNLSCSSFVPKPHTPFQWHPQMTIEETECRYRLVKQNLGHNRIRFKSHKPRMSFIEGILSRGDRRVSALLAKAHELGCRFDEWEEHFNFSLWEKAISETKTDVGFYLHRMRTYEEILPWDHLFSQMDKNFLWEELERAHDAAIESIDPVGADPSVRPALEKNDIRFMGEGNHGGLPLPERRGLKPLPDHHSGFTEDCSTDRCSNCGVCDYRTIKNKIYNIGTEEILAKKGHRESYGWNRVGAGPRACPSMPIGDDQTQGRHGGLPLQIQKYRIRYSKTGEARYMGHLELMGVLKRALMRAKIPVAFSGGFHPQIRLSMGPPLTLGIESVDEYFDIELTEKEPELMAKLNAILPGGVVLLESNEISLREKSLDSSIEQFSYEVTSLIPEEETKQRFLKFLGEWNQKDIWIVKREGKKDLDLKKVFIPGDGLGFSLRFNQQDGSIRPYEAVQFMFQMENPQSQVILKKTGCAFR